MSGVETAKPAVPRLLEIAERPGGIPLERIAHDPAPGTATEEDLVARLAWLVYPKTRTVRVYSSPEDYTLLSEAEILDGGPVLPGFHLSIRDWFQRTQPPRRR